MQSITSLPRARPTAGCPFCSKQCPLGLEAPAPERPKGPSYALYRCASCAVAFVSPPPEEAAERYFPAYYGDYGPFAGMLQSLLLGMKRRRVEGRQGPGSLLDYGCGSGDFVLEMAEHGWDVRGIEPMEPAHGRLPPRIRGLVAASLDALGPPAPRFDAITLWHALEHLPDPEGTLRRLRPWLKDGGTLLVAVPNLESWEFKLAGRLWFHLDLPRHRFSFGAGGLAALLSRSGYETLSIDHFSWAYNVFGLLQTFLNLWTGDVNALYDRLKRGSRPPRRFPWLRQLALAPAAAALAWALCPALGLLGKAGTFEVTARKRPEGPSA